MSREISHRYLKDRNGDTYFPVTHIDAIEGLEVEGENNPFINIAEKVEQLNKMIENKNKLRVVRYSDERYGRR